MSMIREWWVSEKTKYLALPSSERRRYIWGYYRCWILGILAIVFLLIWLIIRIITNVPACRLYVIFANTRQEVGTGSVLWQDFVDTEGYDLKEARVEFDAASYFDYMKNQARGNQYYNAFVGLADAGVLDAITMEPDSLAALGQSGRLLNLNADLCASIRERYGDRLIYYQPEEGEAFPVGIDLSDSILMTEYHLYVDGCALGIGVESTNLAEVEAFLSFVLGGK